MSHAPSPTPAPFPHETAWSVILAATDRQSAEYRSRVEAVARLYWKPAWWYLVRVWNLTPEDAADVVQELFASLLEDDWLAEASRERGRFRTFLKLKLRDLVVDELRRRGAKKRGGDQRLVSIERASDESVLELEWKGLSPDEQFDRVWARCLMVAALDELRSYLESKGRHDVVRAFWGCVIDPPGITYQACADELGVKVNDVGNLIFRARAQLKKILRRHIRESVRHEAEEDDELALILRMLEP